MSQENNLGNIAVLGSTGSIGQTTLEVVRANREMFKVCAIAGNKNASLLVEQAREFEPELVAVSDEKTALEVQQQLGSRFRVEGGDAALESAASLSSVHTVMAAVMGFAGLGSVLTAIAHGKHVALANKESLVAGGKLVTEALAAAEGKVALIPVDSEHSSIFQCLLSQNIKPCLAAEPAEVQKNSLRRIILTASGGPFLNTSPSELKHIRPQDALKHPRWSMGAKITIDSATMMNKGLELIEASWLFQLPTEALDVLIHPQSIVHGLVEFDEGSVFAALSHPDMSVPVAFALGHLCSAYPAEIPGGRIRSGAKLLDLALAEDLQFFALDHEQFPAVRLCISALKNGQTVPAVLNAANEVAVEMFLNENIPFSGIHELVARVVDSHEPGAVNSLEDVFLADSWARKRASELG